ncbi:hypothetical protein [Spiroplasma endosymbiont of Sarcophaga carnaria]|uniref:hypothetical protein n=1 Tax=Spiroplasma endosymbiont of Sarcophaga carnaria TaxID=3066303 RepID=UPI0030CE012F
MNVLAIDLGGNSSKCAVFSTKKTILCEFKVATKKEEILENLKTEIDENKNYVVNNILNNKSGNIVGKNLILSFEKLKQENKKKFNLQNKNDNNNDLLNKYNNNYDNKTTQQKFSIEEEKQLLEDLENIDNPNYWDNGFYLGYNKYEKIV